MATKKKTRKKQTKSKNVSAKKKPPKIRVTKRSAPRKSTKRTSKKTSAKKKAAPKKTTAKSSARSRKATARKTARGRGRPVRGKSESVATVAFSEEGLRPRSGGQSGDLQGLSNIEGAASESVGELLEEGNAFEADAVKGVEDAEDEGEVHTHEVPEDDVPGEYLDEK